jgi:hypothetical protein
MRVPVYLKQEQARCGTITEHEIAARSGTIAVSAIRVRGALHRARAASNTPRAKIRFHSTPKWDAEQQSMSLPLAMRYFPVIAVTERGPPLRCAAQHALFADENLFFFLLSPRGTGAFPVLLPPQKAAKPAFVRVCALHNRPHRFSAKKKKTPCPAMPSHRHPDPDPELLRCGKAGPVVSSVYTPNHSTEPGRSRSEQ